MKKPKKKRVVWLFDWYGWIGGEPCLTYERAKQYKRTTKGLKIVKFVEA